MRIKISFSAQSGYGYPQGRCSKFLPLFKKKFVVVRSAGSLLLLEAFEARDGSIQMRPMPTPNF